ncbi:phage holin family protein [Curtobacterium sp. RRHDQ10]|uniref:phage holin family protein n=1 Tax=Curtobacterium phyllosphaerae TaxID=3413379 RepID=UPI003BEF9363
MSGETPSPQERAATTPLGELLTDVTKDISTLFRQEVALAKAEVAESAKKAGKGAGMLGGAGLTGLYVLFFLSIAAWWALGYLVGNAWSALIIAGVYLIVTAILALLGRAQLRQVKGLPQTADTVKEIPDALMPNSSNPNSTTRSNA